MEASIIIPAKNEERNIGACLTAVYAQAGVGEFEVIVIDSGSRDRTADIARSYPTMLVQIRAEDFHHARTRNLGASLASGEYIVFLAGDALPANVNWLKNLLGNFAQSSVGAVYGKQIAKPDAAPERAFFMEQRYGPQRLVKSGEPKDGSKHRHYQFSTVNGAIRRHVWASTPFPEDFPIYEDFFIATRILKAGYSIVYDPEAAVIHSHNYSLLTSFRRYFDTGVLYKRLDLWDSDHKNGLRSDGIRYLLDEMRHLVSQGASYRCPYVFFYEAARYLGILLGSNNHLLPQMLKKHMSSYGLFN